MNPTLKRALLIAGFVIVVLGMLFVIYLIFFRGTAGPTTNNANVSNINGLPTPTNGNVNTTPSGNVNGLPLTNTTTTKTGPNQVAEGGATLATPIVNNQTAGATVGSGGGLQYYDRPTGKFYQYSPDGVTRTQMTTDVYHDVQKIYWDPAGTKAVLTFPDGSKILYDFTKKKQTTLPSELDNFSFSPSGTQMTSKYLDAAHPDNQWLMVSNPDGTGSNEVEQLAENASKVYTDWSPNNTVIATYESSATSSTSDILFLGKNSENLPSVTVDGRGFVPKWSPDGTRILFSTYSEYTDNAPHLYIMDGSMSNLGKNIVDLGLATRADKCTFSQDGHTIFCAVPYYPVTDSGPVPSLSYSVPDNLYTIDLLTGTATMIARPVDAQGRQNYSIGSLNLSTDESSLFFTDVQTGYIHRILLR